MEGATDWTKSEKTKELEDSHLQIKEGFQKVKLSQMSGFIQ